MNNFDSYLKIAKELSYSAGSIMKDNFMLGVKKEWKEDLTPVTLADKKINSLVIKKIKEHFPEHNILGEEESTDINNECVWVCDPIDGTFPYSHGIPTSVFSLALTINGESVLGVIYDPYTDRLFHAIKDKGAYLNGKKMLVSSEDDWNKMVIDVETWYKSPFFLDGIENILNRKGALITGICSTVYPGSLVAAGIFSGVIFSGNTPWDIAALKILVEEAGGKVTDLYGNDQKYNGPIKGGLVTNGLIHDEILQIIKPLLSNS